MAGAPGTALRGSWGSRGSGGPAAGPGALAPPRRAASARRPHGRYREIAAAPAAPRRGRPRGRIPRLPPPPSAARAAAAGGQLAGAAAPAPPPRAGGAAAPGAGGAGTGALHGGSGGPVDRAASAAGGAGNRSRCPGWGARGAGWTRETQGAPEREQESRSPESAETFTPAGVAAHSISGSCSSDAAGRRCPRYPGAVPGCQNPRGEPVLCMSSPSHRLPSIGFRVNTPTAQAWPQRKDGERRENDTRVFGGNAGTPLPQHPGPAGGSRPPPRVRPCVARRYLYRVRAPGVGPAAPTLLPGGAVASPVPGAGGEAGGGIAGARPRAQSPPRGSFLPRFPPVLPPAAPLPRPPATRRPARRGRSQARRCPRLTHILRPRPRRFPAPPPTARGVRGGPSPLPAHGRPAAPAPWRPPEGLGSPARPRCPVEAAHPAAGRTGTAGAEPRAAAPPVGCGIPPLPWGRPGPTGLPGEERGQAGLRSTAGERRLVPGQRVPLAPELRSRSRGGRRRRDPNPSKVAAHLKKKKSRIAF